MRIMLIMNLGYAAGGAEKSVLLIKNELEKRGHVVCMLTTDKIPTGKQRIADVTIPGINAHGIVKFLKYTWYGRGRREVARAIKNFQPGVIHIHTIGEFSPSVLWSFRKTLPAVMTVHGPEGFVRKLLPWQLPASDYKNHSYKRVDLKLIGKLRTMYFLLFQRPLYRLGMKRLKYIIAPSRYMFEILHTDVNSKQLLHIYNGIELPRQSPVPKGQTILYVGRLEVVKGIATLVSAMSIVAKKLPDAQLIIVGDGSERKALENQAKQAGQGNVTFTGWVTIDEAVAFNKQAIVMAIPSVWPENLPTVALEALGTGRAIVGSNVGGIPELVKNGSNGFVVEPNDPAALAESLLVILSDPKQAARMGKASAELSKQFDIKIFIDRIEALYLDL